MFVLILFSVLIAASSAVEFQIINKEIGAIWVGILGNGGKPHLANGGFILEAGQSRSVYSPNDWAGRFWARTWCDYNSNHCLTGDCGNRRECNGAGGAPPASLAEIALNQYNGLDFYDISLVDGFNLAISIQPVGGSGSSGPYGCTKAACERYLNDECPNELRLNTEHGTIGCKSACIAFGKDEYCCTNGHNSPNTCPPTSYSRFFKDRCPGAYSYAYDDKTSTYACKAQKYVITFGL